MTFSKFTPVLCIFFFACTFNVEGLGDYSENNLNNSNNINNINNTNNTNSTNNINNINNSNNINNANNVDSCGNDTIDTGEDCDGSEFGSATCGTLGYYGTGLTCDASCQFDISQCEFNGQCGNNTIETTHEVCDGIELGGETCNTLGYHGTGLACDNNCEFDETVCQNNGFCGNGEIELSDETCDGNNLGGKNCTSLGLGLGPLTCTFQCDFNTSACLFQEICNDGIDNNSNGDIDCDDTNCSSSLLCQNAMCTEFDTSMENLQLPSLGELAASKPVTSFSVSYWIKLNGVQPDWAAPMGACTNGSWQDGFGFYISTNDYVRFWINNYTDAVDTRASTTTSLVSDVWYHVVGTFDASLPSENIKVYLNGVLEDTGNLKVAVSSPDESVTIGAINDGDGMVGRIDEVGFWSNAISPQNVTAIYNNGTTFNLNLNYGNYNQSANLTAFYRMGDGDTLPNILDHANSHDGTIQNGNGDELVSDTP
jgi:Concanavalin A-like lectin/glucanases superfamily